MTSLLLEGGVLATILTIAAWFDVRAMRIPNFVNLALVVTGVVAAWINTDIVAALIGVASGYVLLFGANALYRVARGRDGVGLGDAKLLAGGGAWIGWMGLPFVVLIGSALGLAYVAALRLAGRELQRTDKLPFGPFLCIAIMVVWIALEYR